MALSAIGEGCHQQMEGILNEIVNFVLLFLQDPVSTSKYLIHTYYHSSHVGTPYLYLHKVPYCSIQE